MKPLSEKLEELRETAKERQLQSVPDVRGSYRGLFDAADLLQAWLREAVVWTREEENEDRRISSNRVFRKLLGTTRQKDDSK